MERVECTLCHRTFDDTTLLSLHQEYEGCFTTNPSVQSDKIVCCPICDKVFDDSIILQIHVNEEHDQNPVHTSSSASARSKTTVSDSLYAQDLERRQRMKHKHEEESQAEASAEPSQEDQDAIIARMLQEEENAQSFEEFRVRALI